MTDPIKVAVLGMAHDHLWSNLRELADQEGASLVGGADPNPVLQDRFRERSGLRPSAWRIRSLARRAKPGRGFRLFGDRAPRPHRRVVRGAGHSRDGRKAHGRHARTGPTAC